MSDIFPLHPGQILKSTLFNEPIRVETIHSAGRDMWIVGLVGTQSVRFCNVTLTAEDFAGLTVLKAAADCRGDGRLLHLRLQAYALGIAYEFDPYFGLSISGVDSLPHQLTAAYDHLLKQPRLRLLLGDDSDTTGRRAYGDFELFDRRAPSGIDEPMTSDPLRQRISSAIRLTCPI